MPILLATHPSWQERPFAIAGTRDFNALALDLFHLHAAHNPVYRGFLQALRVDPAAVEHVDHIPCLPIGFFRNHRVLLEGLEPAVSFTSSGTTQLRQGFVGQATSTTSTPYFNGNTCYAGRHHKSFRPLCIEGLSQERAPTD